jgi:hypothetical protein
MVIKIRRAEHVARLGRGKMHTGFWWGILRETDYLEDTSVDGRIHVLLRRVFRNGLGRHGMD